LADNEAAMGKLYPEILNGSAAIQFQQKEKFAVNLLILRFAIATLLADIHPRRGASGH